MTAKRKAFPPLPEGWGKFGPLPLRISPTRQPAIPPTLRRLETAGMKWWKTKRPTAWTLDLHLQCPTINCTITEDAMAKSCAAHATYLRRKWNE